MTSPIDTAFVEVQPDFGGFESRVDREVGAAAREIETIMRRALDSIARESNRSADDIARQFERGGERAEGSLDEIGRSAQENADDVERAFEQSGEEAEDALREVGNRGEREFDRIEREARDASRSVGRGFGGLRGGIAALGGALAAVGIGAFIADSVQAADQLQDAFAVTEQIIRQTEGAAGLLATEVQEISRALSLEIGVDSAQVQEAANVLLTFKNVSSDTFDTALGLAADLSTVLGTDLNGATLQLGKALNDPVAGINALSRAGVQFTDAQKEQIASLVESNDLLGAQEIILGELESQVGGTAAATADSWAIVMNTFRELQRSLGAALIPAIDAIAPALISTITALEPAFTAIGTGLGDALTALGPAIETLSAAFGEALEHIGPALGPVGAAIGAIVEALAPLLPVIGRLIGTLLPPLAQIIQQLAEGPLTVLADAIAGLLTEALIMLEPHLPLIVDLFGQIAQVMAENLQQTLPIIADLLLQILAAVIPLIPDLVELALALLPLAEHSDTWVQLLQLLSDLILAAVLPAIEQLSALLQGDLAGAFPVVTAQVRIMRDIIEAVVGFVMGRFRALRDVASAVFGAIRSIVRDRISAVVSAANRVRDFVSRIRNFFGDAVSAVRSRIGSMLDLVRGIPRRIRSAIGNLGSLLRQAGRNVIQGLINGINSMISSVRSAISNVASNIRDALPFSPARYGPLSGRGSPELAGEKIARMIAEGIESQDAPARAIKRFVRGLGSPELEERAAAEAASTGGIRVSPTSARGQRVVLELRGDDSAATEAVLFLLRKAVRVQGGGDVQVVLGRRG